ncbi:MAG: ABC transporter ATP-binding protein [Candidatus Rokubacteria bacterium]|nr:ABC transporter ATP-binding protein [Candidatus Rokubacteria bacterium]
MLEVSGLRVAYGKIQVVWGVSLDIVEGETVAVIGANGAGKTTLMRTFAGLLRPSAGRILFRGREIGGMPPHEIARQGLALVPEGRELFPHMSVAENLLLGARLCRSRQRATENLEWVYELFPVLRERRRQSASTLSGGEQQMLAIARALMASPSLLLLDEPSTGLSPLIVGSIFEVIARLRERGGTTLLVEQNVHLALAVAHRAYVLERGRVTLEGPGRELMTNALVRESYLGVAGGTPAPAAPGG